MRRRHLTGKPSRSDVGTTWTDSHIAGAKTMAIASSHSAGDMVATPSGHENRAAAHLAVVQIVERLLEVSQWIGTRVQRDLTTGGQDHQLGQVVVGPDEVSDEVDLGRDDVDRRNVERATVANDVVI